MKPDIMAKALFRYFRRRLYRSAFHENDVPDLQLLPHRYFSMGLILVFVMLVMTISAVGYFHYCRQSEALRQNVQVELSAIADLKTGQLTAWFQERLNDSRVIFGNALLERNVRQSMSETVNSQARMDLENWARDFAGAYGYRVSLYRSDGTLVFTVPFQTRYPETEDREHFQHAVSSREIVFDDLHIVTPHLAEDPVPIRLGFWIPIWPEGDKGVLAEGVWKLESDPNAYLYPLIQRWPLPSKTAESLLVRREGNDVIFLNELRHRSHSLLTLRIPIASATHLPATWAVQQNKGIMEGRDYRDIPVLAAFRAVPGTPWSIVAKVDTSEIYFPLRNQAWNIGIWVAFCIVVAGMTMGMLGRYHESHWYKKQLFSEQERAALAGQVEYLNKHASDIIMLADKNWNILEANVRALYVYGYSSEEMLSLNMRDLIAQDCISEKNLFFDETESGEVHIYGGFHRRRDQSLFPAESSRHSAVIGGKILRQIIVRDITERKLIEEQLYQEREFTRALLESIADGVIACNAEGRLTLFNKTARAWHNMDARELPPDRWAEQYHLYQIDGKTPLCKDSIPLYRAWSGEEVRGSGVIIATPGQPIRHIIADGGPFYDEHNRMLGAVVAMHDITEQYKAEQAKQEREEALTAIFENIPVLILLLNQERQILKANTIAEGFCELSAEEMIGKRAGEALRCLYSLQSSEGCGSGPHCEYCTIRNTLNDTLTNGISHHQVEVTLPFMVGKEERFLSFLISSTPLRIMKEGMVLVSILDITGRRTAEEERVRLVTAIEQAAEAILLIDVSGVVQYVNPAYERISGKACSTILGENWTSLFHCDRQGSLEREMQLQIQQGEVWQGKLTNNRQNGTQYETVVTVSPVFDMAGRVVDYVMILRDITREIELESQLLQSQKLEALGTLAGGIAHDFNNILQAVLGYADLAEAQVMDNSRASACIKEVQLAGRRASELVSQILAFSRHSKRALAPVRIQSVIKEAAKLLRGVLPSTIEIRQKIDSHCEPVMADLMQIHQVLMNLCTNANHAMREGGILEIVLDSVDMDRAALNRHVDMRPGRYVRLQVSDTGSGIETSVLTKIFDPFFTTKKEQQGTGLGLAIVRNIVESHGGCILVESEIGRGTTFTILFPAMMGTVESDTVSATSSDTYRGTERILFVDDEIAIAKSGKRAMENLGYQITVCSNGMDALMRFQENPYDFDLVVTDQTMPQLSGIELAKALLRIRPSLPIIMCTGYSEHVDEEGAKGAGIRDFLMKPVTSDELARHIRQVLNSERAEENATMARLLLPTS